MVDVAQPLTPGYLTFILLAALPQIAWAQNLAGSYPNKPVRVVVPFAPGASTDLIARLLGQKLSEAWSQQFIVDNRGGAGGALGAETVARAEPDGYTLMVTNPGPSLNNILLRKKPPYTFGDFAPIVYIGSAPLIAVANLKFPPNDMKELIAYAKANPGIDKLNREVNRVLRLPEVKQRFDQLGLDVEGGTPEQFGKFIKSQADAMTALIRTGALQPD